MSRYIDADKLIEEIKERIKAAIEWGKSAETEEIKIRAEQAIATFCEVSLTAKKLSTADVRENVKGMWVEVVDRTEMYDKEGVKTWGMLFQCNQCGFVLNAIEGHTGQYNYCPNCGADMRPISALSENVEIVSNLKRGES